MKIILSVSLVVVCIYAFCNYLSLRRDGDEMARSLGYGPNWRDTIGTN